MTFTTEKQKKAAVSSVTDQWWTPPHVIDWMVEFFDGIDTDPAPASDRLWVPAKNYLVDGLNESWEGRTFCNPAYGDQLIRWAMHARSEWIIYKVARDTNNLDLFPGRPLEIIMLVPARTETRWWRVLSGGNVWCALSHRLRFVNAVTREYSTSPMFPSALVYFGERQREFAEYFEKHGQVWKAYFS